MLYGFPLWLASLPLLGLGLKWCWLIRREMPFQGGLRKVVAILGNCLNTRASNANLSFVDFGFIWKKLTLLNKHTWIDPRNCRVKSKANFYMTRFLLRHEKKLFSSDADVKNMWEDQLGKWHDNPQLFSHLLSERRIDLCFFRRPYHLCDQIIPVSLADTGAHVKFISLFNYLCKNAQFWSKNL